MRLLQARALSSRYRRFASHMNESIRIVNYRRLRRWFLLLLLVGLVTTSLIVHHSTKRKQTATSAFESINDSTILPNRTYIASAYLVDSQTIRIVTIRQCNQKMRPFHVVLPQPRRRVHIAHSLIGSSCPWWYQRQCLLVGYFITFRLNAKITVDHLAISDGSLSVTMPLHRPSNTRRRHRLAVCLQPIFLFADWTLMIQFFEYWIRVGGATHFYVYFQSIVPEVNRILDIYRSDSNIEIETINWSYLPIETNSSNDPNNYVYRTEVVTAINDCLLRSRIAGDAYMASVDFDEMIVPMNNFSGNMLIPFLDRYTHNYPNIGAFVFRSANAHLRLPTDIVNLSTINFSHLTMIDLETKIWPIGSRSKWIVRPERVRRCHVHSIIEMDNRRFTLLNVDPTHGIVIHTRRVRDRELTVSPRQSNHSLAPYVDTMNAGWRSRWNNASFVDKIQNRGSQVMTELEMCLVEDFAQRDYICNSPYRCRDRIASIVDDNEWIYANESWIVF